MVMGRIIMERATLGMRRSWGQALGYKEFGVHGDGQHHHGEDVARDEEILGSSPAV